jgi:Lhr-like helicase
MGAVDLVIQVEAPSAASGLQRVGRAGHQVGEISRAALFPSTAATCCTPRRDRADARGQIEAIRVPRTRSTSSRSRRRRVRHGAIDVEEWFETVRRSAPFRTLPRSAYEATLDLLAGRTLRRVRRAAPASSGTAITARSPGAPARSAWRSRAAARSPIAACSASSSPARRGTPAWASSTRRWSTSRA